MAPLLSDLSSLSDAQCASFEKNGYLVLKHMVAPAACDQMLAVTHEHLHHAILPLEYEANVGYPGAPKSLDAPGGKTARRLRHAYQRHSCFQHWAEDGRLLTMLRQLFQESIVLTLAHHNCVMTKHPQFGTATGWHRDIRYWSFTKPDLISVWLALGPENAANGGLHVIPGSHRLEISRTQLDNLDFLRPEVPENQALFASGISLDLEQGDVLLFHSRLFHAAGKNTTKDVKTSVVFAYHGTGNAPVENSPSATAGEVLLG